jgi:hypothetical protein
MSVPDGTLHLDFDRARRCGFPEVVYGAGKTVAEVVTAATRIHAAHGTVLVTRVAADALAALAAALPAGEASPRCGCFLAGAPVATHGPVAVVSAGTADEPVAEEVVVTLRARGVAVRRLRDCGVAGVHRLLDRLDEFIGCRAIVAVAGMDAALATVLGGLVSIPLIAVPTSVGYGVAAGGHAALHSMLASCAPGVTVVNIDNGFGAGYAAATISRQFPPTAG